MIYAYYTGGTIGMTLQNQVLQPDDGFSLEHHIQKLALPNFDLALRSPLLDSADMHVQDYLEMAQHLVTKHNNYSGFVILHGTDTMGYTANFLHEFLSGIQKPIILTGSQTPIGAKNSDANSNLKGAFHAAKNTELHGVFQFFAGALRTGAGLRKMNTMQQDAFRSYDDLPEHLKQQSPLKPPLNHFPKLPMSSPPWHFEVYTLDAHTHLPTLKHYLSFVDGLVFQLGNNWESVAAHKAVQSLLSKALDQGLFLANNAYESIEALLAKLYYGKSLGWSLQQTQQLFRNLNSGDAELYGLPPVPKECQPLTSKFLNRSTRHADVFQTYTMTPYGNPQKVLPHLLQNAHTLVLETYGSGTAPQSMISLLKQTSNKPQLIGVSQCPKGPLKPLYAATQGLQAAGVSFQNKRRQDVLDALSST